MKTQATPRPWSFNKVENYIESQNGGLVASVRTGGLDPLENYDMKIRANAELIVRAVNCHDELVEIVENKIKFITQGGAFDESCLGASQKKYLKKLRNLLKHAKGEV